MPTYREWNQALISFTTQGIPRGEYVFLLIDEDAIEAIGSNFVSESPAEGWVADFKRAVRSQCIARDRIDLNRIMNPLRDDDVPRYVGFLAAMVLAAHYMGEDEDKGVHGTDYFTHLNHVFGLDSKIDRAGMRPGAETPLWHNWQRWLRSRGFLPSLQEGSGKYKYIGYPISQALLRQSDKDKLWRHFGEHRWAQYLDEDTLMSHVRADRRYLTKHLRDLLNPEEPRSLQLYDSLRRVCYEVYESWVESGGPTTEKRARTNSTRRVIRCGILREVDSMIGTKGYFLYPKQPPGITLLDAEVAFENEVFPLFEDRPGWFAPLWQLDTVHFEGLQAEVTSNHPTIQRLELSPRDFWILISDPDVPESDTVASWRPSPVLGEPFVLLCRKDLNGTIQRLRNEGLIEFDREAEEVWDGWLEYENVLVASEPKAWQGIKIQETALLESLQPRITFKLGLRGGLRAPGASAWIVEHGPSLTVSAFYPQVYIQVVDAESDEVFVPETDLETGQMIPIEWNRTGTFLVSVRHANLVEEQVVQIVNWDTLQIAPPPQHVPEDIKRRPIFGAIVQDE